MPRDAYAIDTDANPKLADAHEGARPPDLENTDADTSQNCADAVADKSILIETLASCIPFPVC